jgi:hypothetical protein
MAGDATDQERKAIFSCLVAEANQHQEAKEKLMSLASWLDAPWMSHSSTRLYIESILPLIEPDNQLPWLLSLADKLPREECEWPVFEIIRIIADFPGEEGYQQVTPQAVTVVEWLTKQLEAELTSNIFGAAYLPLLRFRARIPNWGQKHVVYSRASDAVSLLYNSVFNLKSP